MTNSLEIEIIKCSIPDAWYENKIGEKFTVQDVGGETGECYGVAIDSIHKFWYILMNDCKVLNK
mgnify:CR=1 FL=1